MNYWRGAQYFPPKGDAAVIKMYVIYSVITNEADHVIRTVNFSPYLDHYLVDPVIRL